MFKRLNQWFAPLVFDDEDKTRQELAERKHVEIALRESEARFRTIFEQSSDALILTNERGEIVEWNRAAEQLTGYKRQEIQGEFIWDVQYRMLPEAHRSAAFREQIRSQMEEVIRTGTGPWINQQLEGELHRADGESRHFQQVGFCIPAGEGYSIASIMRDVTERKLAEEESRLNESRLNSLLDLAQNSPQLTEKEIIQFGLEQVVHLTASKIGYFHFVNEDQETIELYTWSKETLDECEAVYEKHYPISMAGVWADCARLKEAVIHNDYPNLPDKRGLPEGHAPLYRHLSVPVIDGDKVRVITGVGNKESDYDEADVRQLQLLSNDVWKIMHRKRAEDEIKRLNETLEERVTERTAQLEAALKELETLSYNVSHSLRAPLRAIDGYSHIVVDDYSDLIGAEGQRYLKNVRQSAQRMGEIIDDLLKMLRVTRVEMRKVSVDLSLLAEQTMAVLREGQPGRDVEVVIRPGLVAHGDPDLLQNALENLLGNALKFTEKQPQARIELGAAEMNGGTGYYVRDNGAGFDMTYAHKLFDPFERLHSDDEFAGLGAGLAITQRIIQRHGGRIWAQAEVEKGATFYFTLPEDPIETGI